MKILLDTNGYAGFSALTGGAGRGYKMEGFSSVGWRGVESEGSGMGRRM